MEQTLHFPGHTALSVAVVATLSILGLLIYIWRSQTRARILLLILRVIAIGGIVVAWLQPSWRTAEVVRQKSTVLVLVDGSVSMATTGSLGLTRADAVAEFFVQHRSDFEDLEGAYDMHYFAFADSIRTLTRTELETPLNPIGGKTDAFAALEMAKADFKHVGGAIIITDGIDNEQITVALSKDIARQPSDRRRLQAINFPIHVIVPSDGPAPLDIAIERLSKTNYLLQRNLTEIDAKVTITGTPDLPLAVKLFDEAGLVDEKAGYTKGGVFETVLSFLPKTPGRRILRLETLEKDGEATKLNNKRVAIANVIRDRIRVAHISGYASWDQRFLREYLKQRRDTELVSFHTLRDVAFSPLGPIIYDDGETTLIPFPSESLFVSRIESFDLMILQDYELPATNREHYAEGVIKFVENGGALLFISGDDTLGLKHPWPKELNQILPVLPPKVQSNKMLLDNFEVSLTEEGVRSPILVELKENVGTSLPPLQAISPIGEPVSNANVLMVAEAGVHKYPVLITSDYGRGRVAVLLTDVSWKWSFHSQNREAYYSLLNGLIAFLIRDPSADLLQVTAERPRITPGSTQQLRIKAVPGTKVRANIRNLDSDLIVFEDEIQVDGDEHIMTTAPIKSNGPHAVETTCDFKGTLLKASDVFLVTPTDDELDGMTSLVLTTPSLAKHTGGQAVTMDEVKLDTLALKPEVVTTLAITKDTPLWDNPIVLIIILLALIGEWIAERKLERRENT